MEVPVTPSTSMATVQIHSWRWVISLIAIWIIVLFFIGMVSRRIAENASASAKISDEKINNGKEKSHQEAFWKTTCSSITDGVVFADTRNYIVMCNPAFTKLTGYDVEEIKDREVKFLFAKPETFLSKEEDFFQIICEMECSHKDGSVIPMETKATHIKDNDGELIGYLIILRDISRRKAVEKERKKLETKLIQSCKMEAIATLAGGIAHDFNNILGIIFMNTDMALDDIPEGNPARINIQRIVQASTRARSLVEQILVYSRQKDQKLIPLMPGSLVKESLQFLRSTTPASVKIVKHVNDDFRSVLMDPAQMHQLLLNLFSNAVLAVGGLGTVKVNGTVVELNEIEESDQQNIPAGHYFRLSITNTGVGMDRKAQERIFDPFYTTLKVGNGTGMGLATAMGIVRIHGGHIRVDSEPGSGTTIVVYFPIVEPEEDWTEIGDFLQGTEHILLVDDEHMLVEMATIFLRRQGFRVTGETNSLKALATFRSKADEFDIVITDQTMPELTGSELAVEMFKIRSDIPIILLSGYSKTISDEEVKELGIREFLHKPFNGKILVRSIRKVLDE